MSGGASSRSPRRRCPSPIGALRGPMSSTTSCMCSTAASSGSPTISIVSSLDGEAPDPAAGRPRRDRGDPASLRGADRPFGRLCRDGGLARTATRCGITPAGRLRKPPDRLCAALDRCRSQGRAGARRPCLDRLDAARARRLGRSHGQELSVERSDLRPDGSARRRFRYGGAVRHAGFPDRRAGLQHLRREGRKGDDAGSRQPARHHAPIGAGALRRTRHRGRG